MTFRTSHWLNCDSAYSQNHLVIVNGWVCVFWPYGTPMCTLSFWLELVIKLKYSAESSLTGRDVSRQKLIIFILFQRSQIMVWRDHCGQCSWHNPKLDVDPPGPECWLPCFACGPDERLLTPEWWPLLGWPIGLASMASHWSISGLTDLWLAETGLDTHNISHLTLSNNYPEGDKLSRLGDETKHDVSLVSYATVLQSQVVRQHQPIRGHHSGSQPMSRQTAQQSHLRHFIPRREWFYGSNFLCSFKTGGSEFQVTAGTLSSHWLNNNVQGSHWLRDFYSAVSTF